MKKIVLPVAILFLMAACNQPESSTDRTASDKKDSLKAKSVSFPTTSQDSVLQMAAYYKTLKLDINTNVVQVMSLESEALRSIMTSGTIKFITGAYMDDNPFGKKNSATIFIETSDGKGALNFYDVHALFEAKGINPVICPPPGDCGIPLPK